jgi:hypothetical protein
MQKEELNLKKSTQKEENKSETENNEITEQEDEYKDTRESLDRDSTSQIDSTSNRESSDRENFKLNTDSNVNITIKSVNADNSLKSEEDVSNYEDIDEYESLLQSQISESDKNSKNPNQEDKETYSSSLKNEIVNDENDDDDNNYEDYEDDADEPTEDRIENNKVLQISKKTTLLSNSSDPSLVSFKKGQFFEHDCRIDDNQKFSDLKLNGNDNHEKSRVNKSNRQLSPERWGHDKFLVNNINLNGSRENIFIPKTNQNNRIPKNLSKKNHKNIASICLSNKEHQVLTIDSNLVTSNTNDVIFSQKEKQKSFKNTNECLESKTEMKHAKGLSLSEYMQQNQKNGTSLKIENRNLSETTPNKIKNYNNLNQLNEKYRSANLKSRLDFRTRVPTILDSSILDANGNLIYSNACHYPSQSFTKRNSSSNSNNNYNSSKNYDLKITTDFNSSRLVSINHKNQKNLKNSYRMNDRVENYPSSNKNDEYHDYKHILTDKEDLRNNCFNEYINDVSTYQHDSKDTRVKSYDSRNFNKNPKNFSPLNNYSEKRQDYDQNHLNQYSNQHRYKQNINRKIGRPTVRENNQPFNLVNSNDFITANQSRNNNGSPKSNS